MLPLHRSQRQRQNSAFVPPITPILATAAAVALEALTRVMERRRDPPGQLIALRKDGRRLHVIYHAPPSLLSQPCVVFESGANSWSAMWDDVASRVGNSARVLRYDRPGFGFSQRERAHASPSRSIFAIASDLRATLLAANASPPYIFVAHSLGALYVNAALSALRPGDVHGVVYVDAASPRTVRLLRDVVPSSTPPTWLARMLGALGVLRLVAPLALRRYKREYKGELGRQATRTWARGDWLLAYTGEWMWAMRGVMGGGDRLERLCEAGWLGHLPITVLVPDVYRRTHGMAYIASLQEQVAEYSRDAVVMDVQDCGHFVQIERPEVVAEAVADVIRRARDKMRQPSSKGSSPADDQSADVKRLYISR